MLWKNTLKVSLSVCLSPLTCPQTGTWLLTVLPLRWNVGRRDSSCPSSCSTLPQPTSPSSVSGQWPPPWCHPLTPLYCLRHPSSPPTSTGTSWGHRWGDRDSDNKGQHVRCGPNFSLKPSNIINSEETTVLGCNAKMSTEVSMLIS